eukprot:6548290-Prymnesium_polylepis.1
MSTRVERERNDLQEQIDTVKRKLQEQSQTSATSDPLPGRRAVVNSAATGVVGVGLGSVASRLPASPQQTAGQASRER